MKKHTCKHCGETKPLDAKNWTYNTRATGSEFHTGCCRLCWNQREYARRRAKRAAFIGPHKPNGFGFISGAANKARWKHHKN